MYALNLMETAADPTQRNTSSYARSPAHDALALTLAESSITLLKNDGGFLPIPPASVRSVAVFGDTSTISGGGSGGVVRPYVVTPQQGIASLLNPGAPAPVTGVCPVTENGIDYNNQGSNLVQVTAGSPQDCCNACAATAGCAAWTLDGADCYLKSSAAGRVAAAGRVSGNLTNPNSPSAGAVAVTYYATQDPAAAAAAAAGADLIVMVVATDSSEGSDRTTLGFPAWQDALVAALGAAGRLVVVARCPGACTMPWAGSAAVPAILYELLPGQESGNSIAATIFGENNPSGKLPLTFPNPAPAGSQFPTDTWLSPPGGGPVIPTAFPGTDRGRGFPEVDFAEELFMGYRWYDAQGTSPQWSFGHGLSYSTFNFSALTVGGTVTPAAGTTIYATVCNTAGPAGAEVAQLYLGYPAAANEPPKLLKGFEKVRLAPGECSGVGFPVAASDLWVWDVASQTWQLVPGSYTVMVGSSSRDIRLTGALTVTA